MRRVIAITLLSIGSAPVAAQTAGSFMLQTGVLSIKTLDDSAPLRTAVKPGLGALIGIPQSFESPGTSATVSDATTVHFALSYFVTDHVAIKAEGGIPPKFYLRGKGVVQPNPAIAALRVDLGAPDNNPIASSRQWSPMVLAQYYFGSPHARWRPVLGVGVTYTYFTDVKLDRDLADDLNATFGRSLALANLNFPIDRTTVNAKSSPGWGPIANIGLSYAFNAHWGAALSLSYIWLSPTSTITINAADGTRLSTSKMDMDVTGQATALLISYTF